MKTKPIRVGDFVYCRSAYHRSQLQLPEELGLVLEVKRSNFKVLYPGDKRCWLPRETLVVVHPDLDYSTFLEKLYFILKRVNAHECELVSEAGTHRLAVRIDGIDDVAIDELRRFLGGGFVTLEVVPEGMAFMQLEIQFRDSVSPPAP